MFFSPFLKLNYFHSMASLGFQDKKISNELLIWCESIRIKILFYSVSFSLKEQYKSIKEKVWTKTSKCSLEAKYKFWRFQIEFSYSLSRKQLYLNNNFLFRIIKSHCFWKATTCFHKKKNITLWKTYITTWK